MRARIQAPFETLSYVILMVLVRIQCLCHHQWMVCLTQQFTGRAPHAESNQKRKRATGMKSETMLIRSQILKIENNVATSWTE